MIRVTLRLLSSRAESLTFNLTRATKPKQSHKFKPSRYTKFFLFTFRRVGKVIPFVTFIFGFYKKTCLTVTRCDAPEERFKLFPTQHTMQMQYNHLSFLTAEPENKTLSGR